MFHVYNVNQTSLLRHVTVCIMSRHPKAGPFYAQQLFKISRLSLQSIEQYMSFLRTLSALMRIWEELLDRPHILKLLWAKHT